MLKHFDFPSDPYQFDMKLLSDGNENFYGFPSEVFNVFNIHNENV